MKVKGSKCKGEGGCCVERLRESSKGRREGKKSVSKGKGKVKREVEEKEEKGEKKRRVEGGRVCWKGESE